MNIREIIDEGIESKYISQVLIFLHCTIRGLGPIALSYAGAVILFIIAISADIINIAPESGFESIEVSALFTALDITIVGVFFLLYLYISKDYKIIYGINKGIVSVLKWTLIGLVLLLIANYGLGLLYSLFDIAVADNAIVEMGQDNPQFFLYLIPVMIILVGPIEEIMFRGLVQGKFREEYSVNTSIFLASLIFGLFHIPAVGGLSITAIPYVITTFVLGMILGYIYEETEDILIPSLAHGVYNSLLLLGQYYILTNPDIQIIVYQALGII